jgi:hypothetical protein
MKLRICRLDCAIDISNAEMTALLEFESGTYNARRGADWLDLYQRLNKIPDIHDTDYDGHFGCSIFFAVAKAAATPAKYRRIKRTIASYLKKVIAFRIKRLKKESLCSTKPGN